MFQFAINYLLQKTLKVESTAAIVGNFKQISQVTSQPDLEDDDSWIEIRKEKNQREKTTTMPAKESSGGKIIHLRSLKLKLNVYLWPLIGRSCRWNFLYNCLDQIRTRTRDKGEFIGKDKGWGGKPWCSQAKEKAGDSWWLTLYRWVDENVWWL